MIWEGLKCWPNCIEWSLSCVQSRERDTCNFCSWKATHIASLVVVPLHSPVQASTAQYLFVAPDFGLAEQVQSHLCLWEQEIPQIAGKIICNACQDGNKIIFEGSNCPLCCIMSMVILGHELIVDLSHFRHQFVLLCTGFIVQDLDIHMLIMLFEVLHDGIIGLHAMDIFPGLEGVNCN